MTISEVKRVDQSGDLPLSRSNQDTKYSRVNAIGTTIADGYFELTFYPKSHANGFGESQVPFKNDTVENRAATR